MTVSLPRIGPARLALALGLCCAVLCAAVVFGAMPADDARIVGGYDPDRMVLVHAILPRLAMALLCGSVLAVAGAVLQQVLRNPLASPTTLGVDAGARLALAISGAFAPALIGIGRDLVALAGSLGALGLAFSLVRGRGFSALNLVLAGLVVSLYCGALSVIITLTKDRYLVGLFVWGSGSLSQISWHPFLDLALRVTLAGLPLVFLWRPLEAIEIGDDAGRGGAVLALGDGQGGRGGGVGGVT